jgi:hypothetical protein
MNYTNILALPQQVIQSTMSYLPSSGLFEKFISFIFLPFFLYFTAVPFLVRFILVPLLNKTLKWNKHKIRWDKQQFKTHLTCSLCIMKQDQETKKYFNVRTLFERNIVDMLYRNMNATYTSNHFDN